MMDRSGGMMRSGNYFELFGLPTAFDLDAAALIERYRELQRVVHPDRFANASERERTLSVQQAALINDAYHTLKAPLSRARYLLSLHGIVLDDNKNTVMDPEFLMEQMEMREALQEARKAVEPLHDIARLQDRITAATRTLYAELRERFVAATPEALEDAAKLVQKLQFLRRLEEEVETVESDLENH